MGTPTKGLGSDRGSDQQTGPYCCSSCWFYCLSPQRPAKQSPPSPGPPTRQQRQKQVDRFSGTWLSVAALSRGHHCPAPESSPLPSRSLGSRPPFSVPGGTSPSWWPSSVTCPAMELARTAAKSHTPCSFFPCTRLSGAQITNHLASSCRGCGGMGGGNTWSAWDDLGPFPVEPSPRLPFPGANSPAEAGGRPPRERGSAVRESRRIPGCGWESQSRDPRSRVMGTPWAGDGQGVAGRHAMQTSSQQRGGFSQP